MTLHYQQTARLNATPLARHIDTAETAKPVYTDLDAMIADMQADAAKIRKRFEHERPISVHAKGRLAEHRVYDYVKDNPGVSTHKVADHFERNIKSIASLLSRMEERNSLKSEMGRNPATKRPVRCFTIVPTRNVKRDHRTQTQFVYDFIKTNPGSNKAAMAHGTGLTVKQIECALTNMTRYPSRFPHRREYENGSRSTVRVWAVDNHNPHHSRGYPRRKQQRLRLCRTSDHASPALGAAREQGRSPQTSPRVGRLCQDKPQRPKGESMTLPDRTPLGADDMAKLHPSTWESECKARRVLMARALPLLKQGLDDFWVWQDDGPYGSGWPSDENTACREALEAWRADAESTLVEYDAERLEIEKLRARVAKLEAALRECEKSMDVMGGYDDRFTLRKVVRAALQEGEG